MRAALAALLLIHGFAHLPGFLVPWRFAAFREMPYKTTVVAGWVDLGATGIRVVGILWLLTGLLFAACGAAILARASWWMPATLIAALFSVVLVLTAWPDSQIGVFVNLAILALLLVSAQVGWAP